MSVSPRTSVQKELGWISLEQGKVPAAISLLTDHLQRNASDYEAYNLLLKCFYLTDRFEAGASLASTLISAKAPTNCFHHTLFLCGMLDAEVTAEQQKKFTAVKEGNPFLAYNVEVLSEQPRAWTPGGTPSLKSKLLFQEYRFGK